MVAVRFAFVDRRHRHHRLHRVHVGRAHHVELLVAHETVLRQRDQVVLRHPARVDLDAKVVAQFRGKQMREPGGLVDALLADEHQHRLVHLPLVEPAGHHRHEPPLQVLVEEHLLLHPALDGHRHRHGEDMVLSVPRRQAVQVVQERLESRHIPGVEHRLQVALPRGLDDIEGRQQGVFETVAHRLPVVAGELCEFAVLTEGIPRRQTGLHTVFHPIVSQVDVVAEERLDLLRRGILLLPRHLVLLFFPFTFFLVAFVVHVVIYFSPQRYEKE